MTNIFSESSDEHLLELIGQLDDEIQSRKIDENIREEILDICWKLKPVKGLEYELGALIFKYVTGVSHSQEIMHNGLVRVKAFYAYQETTIRLVISTETTWEHFEKTNPLATKLLFARAASYSGHSFKNSAYFNFDAEDLLKEIRGENI